ncbi:MAG: FimB/Mfa2 family fimbrial subunit [Lachnospiraceae bacterium]|nr:FimB/Mfa2 family fimbrial subunit [Lachnospiraceae bacterium]
MRLFNLKTRSGLIGTMLTLLSAVAGLSSCDVIYNDLEPCPEGVNLRFVYDYNMEFANAFPGKVHCLTVFVYDEFGKYVSTFTESSRELLSDEGYRMNIELPAGKYRVVAYGGMLCDAASYHFLETPAAGSDITDLGLALNTNIMEHSSIDALHNLHSLFYGQIADVEVKKDTPVYESYTVPMMKDTNNLRMVLQHLSYEDVDPDDFDFRIIDDNTFMDGNNDVVATGTDYSYLPWITGQVSPGTRPSGSEVKNAFAEIACGRLMYNENPGSTLSNPILLITRHSDGTEVMKLPLNQLLLMFKSENYASMPAQEFLDRKSEWDMLILLDEHWKWYQIQIEVSNWIVRINRADFRV